MIPKDVYNPLIFLKCKDYQERIEKLGPLLIVLGIMHCIQLTQLKSLIVMFTIFKATHLGLQRKILAELGKPQSLVAPQELYQFVLLSGLASGPQLEPSLLQQRRCLLNVALEHSLGKKSI